jgi:uncharacterized membrane protein
MLGAVVYSLGTELSYSDQLKKLKYYPLFGVILGMCANFIWYTLVQKIDDKSYIIKLGLYWDVMIVACFLAIPLIFHGVKLTTPTLIGVFLIFIGIILTKMY